MRGEPYDARVARWYSGISTHSPHAGRTSSKFVYNLNPPISTHSPHAGRTIRDSVHDGQDMDFNSLAPCGANHYNRITKG